jgi:hypothetical protein
MRWVVEAEGYLGPSSRSHSIDIIIILILIIIIITYGSIEVLEVEGGCVLGLAAVTVAVERPAILLLAPHPERLEFLRNVINF